MMNKLLIPNIYLANEKAVQGFHSAAPLAEEKPEDLARSYSNQGADELLILEFSRNDVEHDAAISQIKRICDAAEVPVIAGGNVKRMEDVKKLIYAGCHRAILNFGKEVNCELLEEVSKKFGKEKMVVYLPTVEAYERYQEKIETYAGMLFCDEGIHDQLNQLSKLPILVLTNQEDPCKLLLSDSVSAVTGSVVSKPGQDLMELKFRCRQAGILVNTFESTVSWSEFKLNSDGMIPVIVQDYQTDEVLMLAYMNEEAFDTTLRTGKMTYWSRSRKELWTKGMTSGHFQYVKSLSLDCDNDTILAKVSQIGAACHTGNRSCFFQELVKKEYNDTNPLRVFQNVYDVISDRKVHPKEGSYTNYLFDKGIDKILKKVGEECTEIVIAAKNPDPDEIKYEISDFLYHAMVLMVEKGVTWEDITRELARR
ncbi:MAG: bifunctional phosphoribosyl-AMP cyclohydrolase/phosphoribosyl-ATP diphosphatase HisIE [Lachnospiraceae bacterium]|nr:bifunctional phosphoribosyl-AMP cyclohydrolase/phosphoribosyl-ATP diphosphatase HisIE [Lachnospiraceae bacterium]